MFQQACAFAVKAFVVIIMVLGPLWTLVLFKEYYEVGIKGEKEHYPFGNEEAINVGGSHYASAELYSRTTLIQGVVFLIISVLIYSAVFLKRPIFAIGAAIIFLLNVIGNLLLK